MKKRNLALIVLIPLLASCTKTKELYADYAYYSTDFMQNYYTEHNGVSELKEASRKSFDLLKNHGYQSTNGAKGESLQDLSCCVRPEDNPNKYPWISSQYSDEFGRHNNLTAIDTSFAYGYLSKLYDGRVRCEGKYQLSRVQLDKTGYSTFFPKRLENFKYFAFSLRGATDYYVDNKPSPLTKDCRLDIHINFYKHIANSSEYNVVNFNLQNVAIPCDAGGDTDLIVVYLADDINEKERQPIYDDLTDTVAMSFTFELKTTNPELSDDSKADSPYHFAVMLYEVLFPKSSWR